MNKILLVPGLHNSGPDHWSELLARTFPLAADDRAALDKPDHGLAPLASKLKSRRSRVHLRPTLRRLTAIAAARLATGQGGLHPGIVAPADPGPVSVSRMRYWCRNRCPRLQPSPAVTIPG